MIHTDRRNSNIDFSKQRRDVQTVYRNNNEQKKIRIKTIQFHNKQCSKCGRIKVLMFICSSITAKLKGDDGHWFGVPDRYRIRAWLCVRTEIVAVCRRTRSNDDGNGGDSSLAVDTISTKHTERAHESETSVAVPSYTFVRFYSTVHPKAPCFCYY